MKIILIVVALLLVIGIPTAVAIVMTVIKMRRKSKGNYEPPVFQTNQPNQPFNFVPPEVEVESADFKRCPTCKSTFTDINLVFCLTDGTPLDLVLSAPSADKLPVTRIINENFASAPVVYAKNTDDDLPETVQSLFTKGER